ncbi:MAG: putative AraC family transcriptional regulator [Chloroflexi bacterium]|jgi:transcriptional regulator GlxA family with amidase domain|nr:putative AraC family transcriptional regulator [Chloroflexota bacterium]
MIYAMRIGLLVQEGFFGSAVSSIMDIVTTAEAVRSEIDASIPPLEIVVAGPQRRVTSTGGMTIVPTRTLRELNDLDVVVVPALGTMTGPETEAAVESRAGRAMVRALGAIDTTRSRIAAACTGVFPLAETGILDGRRVTTTWFLTPTFRARYPTVSVDLDRMVVADGPILTAGAAFAHVDLALAILRGVSAELTHHVARLLLIDERASQAAFLSFDHLQHDDPIVLAFERYVRQHIEQPFDASLAACAIATSRRTLERRTRQALGMSPLEMVQRLRIERAAHLRRTTNLSTEMIAGRVGYANAETLSALQRRAAGRQPRLT